MSDDKLWKRWVEEFQQVGEAIPKITHRTRRSAIVQVLELLGTVLLCPAVIALIVYRLIQKPQPSVIVLTVIGIASISIAVTYFFWIRRGAWRAAQETPRELLRLLRRQEHARLRELRFTIRLLVGCAIAVAVPIIWRFWPRGEDATWEPLEVGRMALLYVIFGGVTVFVSWLKKRKTRHIAVLDELERGFDEGSEVSTE